jgi:hypothetical protein
MSNRTTVVYVLGTARSGSTLLTSLLGGVDGFFAAGEIRLLWQEFTTRRCGCGELASTCPVWSPVLAAIAARSVSQVERITEAMQQSTPLSALPRILRADDLEDLPSTTQAYARTLAATYHAIADVTGCTSIIDSSKSASEAALLQLVPQLDVVTVHIVRDPRAVVYSWKRALEQGAQGTPQLATWSIALRWAAKNATSEAVTRRRKSRSLQLRYEDLVTEPERHVRAIATLAGTSLAADRVLQPALAAHIVGGNALRKSSQPIQVREDVEWRSALGRPAIAEVAGLTYPLLRHYDYPLQVTS